MVQVLKWGILGAGRISHDFVLGLKSLPENRHKVVVVGDRSKTAAEEFAARHSVPHFYGSHDEFLAHCDNVDVVYIGTIHVTHHSIALKVLEAGKHVLCEKPMTICPQHTRELVALAREKQLFLMEATWMRFFPAVVELRRMIADGHIGEVRFLRANFSFRRPPERAEGRLTDPKLGGGAILDVGVYTISLATMLFGGERPVKVLAEGSILPSGVDDLAAITLTYSNGGVAQLTCSISYSMPCDAFICGTKGDLQLSHPFWCPTELKTPQGVYEIKEGVSRDFPLPKPHLPGNYPNPTGLRYEAEEVYKCLEEGATESGVMSLEESVIVAEVAEEVMRQLGVTCYQN